MKSLLARWESLCASSSVLRFVDVNLRGIGQVMFQDNPLSGRCSSPRSPGDRSPPACRRSLFGGLVAVVAATLTAQWLRVDKAALRAGLYGFNGFLVGLALATFVAPGPLLWAYVVLGAAVSVVAMSATANVSKTWGMPALTSPFVLVTWLLLLATYAFAGLAGSALPAAGVVVPFESVAATRLDAGDVRAGDAAQHLAGVPEGQRLAALLLSGRACGQLASRAAFAASAGAIVAVITAHAARRRERPRHRRPAGLQPGADGDRARHGVLQAGPARRGLRGAGHRVHRGRAGGDQRGADAVRPFRR